MLGLKLLTFLAGLDLFSLAEPLESTIPEPRGGDCDQWVDTWTQASTNLSALFLPSPYNTSSPNYLSNTSIRQTMRVSLGASEGFRLILSNYYGSEAVHISEVTVALPTLNVTDNTTTGSSGIETSTLESLTFSGQRNVEIPVNCSISSDTIDLQIESNTDVSVTMYLEDGQPGTAFTGHGDPQQTSWLASGNQTHSGSLTSQTEVGYWFYATAIEAQLGTNVKAIACVGDSITDGYLSTINGDDRYPNFLFQRLQANGTNNLAVVDQGIAAEGVVNVTYTGTTGEMRIRRDVLDQAGIGYVILLEGVNDITKTDPSVAAQNEIYNLIISAYESIIDQVHSAHLPIFGGTITPFGVPAGQKTNGLSNPQRDATRVRINQWIMTSGKFDAYIDFAGTLANASFPAQLQTQYNAGGWLHPNDLGYAAMAQAINLTLFTQYAGGV